MPLQRNRRTVKLIRMKQVPVKTKKQSDTKSEKDYISETISFVIKGKLTPIKPNFVAKKGKKPSKKKEITDTKQKPMMRKAKKVSENITKTGTKVQTKSAKKPTSATKILKKSTDTSLIQDSKKDIKSENINASKKAAKESKPLKKVKTEIPDVKKKSKKAITKQAKSPQKTEPDENQKAEDIKTKTIEKLLKQANKALKQPQLKSKSTLQKSKKANKPKKAKPEVTIPKKPKPKPVKQETDIKKQIKRKTSSELDDTSTSDELTLNELCPIKIEPEQPKSKKLKIKSEPVSDTEKKTRKSLKHPPKKITPKTNLVLMKKRVMSAVKDKVKRKENQRARKMKLLGFWNGPKRHRVASLNALAKVHCLYENETRSNLLDPVEVDKKETQEEKKSSEDDVVPCTRTLRSVPGLRAVGKHWDMHDTTSSSEDNSGYESTCDVEEKPKPKIKKEVKKPESIKKPEQKRRRNRTELIMDLKDMVVRKRMASLNASAILAASYSVERRASKSPKSDSETDSSDYFITDNEEEADKKCFEANVKKEEDSKLIEVRATPNKKVAVILNQDTDVTITGVYVNSTTRSTHHEGYCSIAGMQYRISATSHTQTAATAVATETLLQSSSSSTQENVS